MSRDRRHLSIANGREREGGGSSERKKRIVSGEKAKSKESPEESGESRGRLVEGNLESGFPQKGAAPNEKGQKLDSLGKKEGSEEAARVEGRRWERKAVQARYEAGHVPK